MPQWVYDADSLAFLDVNEAAITHYGYSREEFLSATLKTIRPAEDIPLLETYLRDMRKASSTKTRLVRHQKKNGEIIYAEVKGKTIEFNGRLARLVVVVDKTSEINAENTKRQSIAKLQEISWIQAHEVRRPLSNLLGLAELLEMKNDANTITTLIDRLKEQALELDLVIRKTTAHLPPEK
jgi:PAS domain S-box-containing protein